MWRRRVPLNKRKINARTNKRPTTNKIVPLAPVDAPPPRVEVVVEEDAWLEEAEVEETEAEEEEEETAMMEKEERKPENGERKLIGGYLLNRTNGGRSESVFVHCLADLIANINMFYLSSNPLSRTPHSGSSFLFVLLPCARFL